METSINIFYAKKLRYLRRKYEKKQQDVAEILNLSQQAYSKLETGKIKFTNATIDRISKFFNITPIEFEKPNEAISIGNNNNNNGNNGSSNIDDIKLINNLQKSHEQNMQLINQLIISQKELIEEKNLRLKQYEEMLNIKNEVLKPQKK